jgi:hypothetical protein
MSQVLWYMINEVARVRIRYRTRYGYGYGDTSFFKNICGLQWILDIRYDTDTSIGCDTGKGT